MIDCCSHYCYSLSLADISSHDVDVPCFSLYDLFTEMKKDFQDMYCSNNHTYAYADPYFLIMVAQVYFL